MVRRSAALAGPARLMGRRGAELVAIFMIGDGLLGLLQPRRHVGLWRSRSPALDALVRPFAEREGARRLYGLAQIASGLTLAAALKRDAQAPSTSAAAERTSRTPVLG